MTAPSIEDGVATSPRLYSSAFKSNVGRFAKVHSKESLNLQYDINVFDTQTRVANSPIHLAHIFAPPKDKPTAVPYEPPIPYNTDSFYMSKTSVEHGQDNWTKNYGFNHTSDRFRPPHRETADAADFYNTATLHKTGIQESVAESPRKYSTMNARTPRSNFIPPVNGEYYPNNHAVEYNVPRSPRKYSVMGSPVGRPDPSAGVGMHDGQYNTDKLHKASTAHEAQSRMNSRAFRAPYRLPLQNVTSAPDKIYDPDCGSKTTIWNDVQKSGNPYQGMIHSARDAEFRVPAGNHLDYDTQANPVKPSLAYTVAFSPRLLHNVRSKTARFAEARPEPQGQAFYDLRRCPKGDGDIQKRMVESPRTYFGGQSMSVRSIENAGDKAALQLQYDANYGKTKSLNKCVEESPALCSAMRSVIPRFRADKKAAAMDEYEQLLRNPDKIELKFQIRGNVVVKKTTDRALLVVGRQAPPGSTT